MKTVTMTVCHNNELQNKFPEVQEVLPFTYTFTCRSVQQLVDSRLGFICAPSPTNDPDLIDLPPLHP